MMSLRSITAITISFSTFSNSRDLNRIKQMDSNENGEISYEEFKASALDRFTLLDTNGDGIVTGEEFMNPVLQQFKNMDLNTDDVLSKKLISVATEAAHPDIYGASPLPRAGAPVR